MSVVQLRQVWVEANFKEGQLRHMRVGQPVRLESDLYGARVTYHGRVEGFSAGTGSAFSMLPSQNAAGNWIKVVQRLPVVISLEPSELAAHPLRVGCRCARRCRRRRAAGICWTATRRCRRSARGCTKCTRARRRRRPRR
ncbi:hlyD secretion family protein [Burkholderia pseudomallei MSHR1000]|nr:hlyD secretion family protein [Burkholderia pseudomallei MSHR1000]